MGGSSSRCCDEVIVPVGGYGYGYPNVGYGYGSYNGYRRPYMYNYGCW